MAGAETRADPFTAWAAATGWQPAGGFRVFALAPDGEPGEAALARAAELLSQTVEDGGALVANGAVAVVQSHADGRDPAQMRELAAPAASELGAFRIGASELGSAPCVLSASFERALFAARNAPERDDGVARFDDCRFEFFAAKTGLEEGFVDVRDVRVVPLYEADRERGTNLLATAVAYIEHGFNVAGTAAALGLHRNGVLYRLNRIRECSGIDLLGPYEDYDLVPLVLTCKVYQRMLDGDGAPAEWEPPC